MSDGFILVTKSNKKKRSRKFNNIIHDTSPLSDFNLDTTAKKLQDIKFELLNSEFYEKSLNQLEEVINEQSVKEIICLGVGKISEDIIAKYQLEFISLIKDKFKIKTLKFYDPVFDHNDRALLNSLNYEIVLDNREGKYTVDQPTIFYLPHCPKQLINNLLFSNWSFEGLRNLILICNSFKKIIESTPERFLRPNAHYLLELNSFTIELEIENSFKFKDLFNDFSIHTFPSTNLPEKSSDFWQNNPEPVYSLEDLEFVKNDIN